MGCLCSKTVTCSRCNRSGGEDVFVLTDNICQRCIQIQQVGEYRRRLAALRDENTTATGPALHSNRSSVASNRSGVLPSVQTSQDEVYPRRLIITTPRQEGTSRFRTPSKTRQRQGPAAKKPLFGEYKCPQCRHHWTSRRSWRDMYQKCQRCGTHVYAHLQRELRNSDMTNTNNPHQEHLCEKCIRLGYYCGNFRRK